MSLEAQIAALIVALDRNTNAILDQQIAGKAAGKSATTPAAATEKPAPVKDAAAGKSQTTKNSDGDTPAEIDYEKDIRLPFLELLKVNRDKALTLIPEGCKTMKDVKPAQYPAVAKAVKALAAELEGDA